MAKKIFFDEQKHYSFYADFRVFIFGVDVTEYVIRVLSIGRTQIVTGIILRRLAFKMLSIILW